jgi:KTSC domain
MTGFEKSPDYGGGDPGKWGWVPGIVLIGLMLAVTIAIKAYAAEQICPKYGNCVSADFFECQDIDRSDLVTRVCFNREKRYMIVRLKQTDYHYCEIGVDTVAAFVSADSMGRFFNQNIKSGTTGRRYDCRDHPAPTFP